MPQFMMMIKIREDAGDPPPELYAAMGEYIGKAMASGNFAGMGGLLPSSQGALVRGSEGKVLTTHGPFAETTELVGGYAIMKAESLAEAVALAEDFVQLHVDHWPGFEGTSEIRQIEDQD